MKAIKNIIGSVFIAIAVLVFWVFILPGYEKQSYFKSSVEIRSSAIDLKSELIQKVADLNKEYQDKFSELKRLSLVVPDEKNIAEVITGIEDISSQSGIHLSDFTVSDVLDSTKTGDYGTLSLNINFSGDYESVLSFLDRIERHIRLINVNNLSVAVKEDETAGLQVMLLATLKADVYFLKPLIKERTTIKTQSKIDENQ